MASAPRCFSPKRTRSSRAGRTGTLAGSRATGAQEARATQYSAGACGDPQTAAVVPAVVPAMRDWHPKALDALLGVVQDASANPKTRRQAAQKIAEFLLPKIAKKPKLIPDEHGFSISPELASAYRDIQLRLRALKPTRKIPAIAQEIEKLEARSAAILRRLEEPCPSRYGNKEAMKDAIRLGEFGELHNHETALTDVQNAEEAHLRTRLDVFRASPEAIARERCAALEDADKRFRRYRAIGGLPAPPLSRQERNELKFWRGLYPAGPKRSVSSLADGRWQNLSGFDDDGLQTDPEYLDHPFAEELLAMDGNFYPRRSKLRHRRWLEQLETTEPKKPTANEDAEDQQNPELAKARMRELEERRAAGFQLTAAETGELQTLRERDPEFAAIIDLMDLHYLNDWRREVEIARKAGLDTFGMFEQADIISWRVRDPTKFISESDAAEYWRRRNGTITVAPL